MKHTPIEQLPPLSFPIVRPPRYPILNRFSSIVTGFAFIFGFGLIFALARIGLADFINIYLETGHFPTLHFGGKLIFVGLIAALALLGYAFYSVRERKKSAAGALYDPIGTLILSPKGCEVTTQDGAFHSFRWEEIQRLDCFFGMGVQTQLSPGQSTFEHIDVMRIRIRANGAELNEYVLNSEKGSDEYGMLYHGLNVIRKISIQHHMKIQMYDQF